MEEIVPRLRRWDKRRLLRKAKKCKDARLRIRYLVVVNLANGLSVSETARVLGVARKTVYRVPGLDGLSVLRALRKQGRQTHVLIITAKDAVPDRVAGLNTGADDYLVKPFEFEELLARVQALVRRGYHRKNPVLAVGPLSIDTSTQQVTCCGTSVDLTAREYALLEYLAMRTGELVTRSDVWEHVYDFHSDASSNVVDVYVGRLRRKIDLEGEPSLIETVRGRGYILRSRPR